MTGAEDASTAKFPASVVAAVPRTETECAVRLRHVAVAAVAAVAAADYHGAEGMQVLQRRVSSRPFHLGYVVQKLRFADDLGSGALASDPLAASSDPLVDSVDAEESYEKFEEGQKVVVVVA